MGKSTRAAKAHGDGVEGLEDQRSRLAKMQFDKLSRSKDEF